jgi:hypothetical protein
LDAHIQEGASGAVFDHDYPNIGIEAGLSIQFGFRNIGTAALGYQIEQAAGGLTVIKRCLWGGSVEINGPVQSVDQQKDRSGVFGAATHDESVRPFAEATTNVGADEHRRGNSHG